MSKVLVIRMSSLGDVAMLVPVLYSVASAYPRDNFVVLTRPAFAPLFSNMAFNVSVRSYDVAKKHKGILGLLKVLLKLREEGFTHVADVHDVLRSKIVRWVSKATLSNTAKIDKKRSEKQAMLETKDTSVFLKHTTERYLDVFKKLGFDTELKYKNFFEFQANGYSNLSIDLPSKTGDWIGIAPFARHEGKIYPLNKMENVVKTLSERENTKLFLFGAGCQELEVLESWASKYPNVVFCSKKVKLDRELWFMSHVDVMLTMDSANMHLASLVNVPVVSIWGATNPALGFYGYKQDVNNAVLTTVKCSPCSVYGDTPCTFKGTADEYKCMKSISEDTVVEKIEEVLAKKG